MKRIIGWFVKSAEGKSTFYPGQLTAENAQKIADAALEAKTVHLGQMTYDFALQSIKEASERAEYSLWYGLYTNGPIASELRVDELTVTQARKIDNFVQEKLVALGYKVELSYYGAKRMIKISWERKEEKK